MTEETKMVDKTRAQLAEENEQLRARVTELEANPTAVTRPDPVLPSYGLSEGTRLDILEAQNRLAHETKITALEITEPFTGKVIRVTAESAELIHGDDESEDLRITSRPEPFYEPTDDNNPF